MRFDPGGHVKVVRRASIYIAGPMTGLPLYNYPAFEQAEDILTSRGHDVRSPHHNGDGISEEEKDRLGWDHFQRLALKLLLECDAIALLPGWERSRGARRELDIALDLGMPVYLFDLNDDYGAVTLITGRLSS